MKIIYSPYFDGKAFDNAREGVVIGKKTIGTSELLCEIELRSGMSHSDKDIAEERVRDYHNALGKCIKEGNLLYDSFALDNPEQQFFPVASQLLTWRDSLLMGGWNGKDALPEGKLRVISDAEKCIPENSCIRMGEADRWKALKENKENLSKDLQIEVRCPKALLHRLVAEVLRGMNAEFNGEINGDADLNIKHPQIYTCNDVTEAYEWLAMKNVEQEQMVVCQDTERMDSVMKHLHKPKVGDAQVGCHKVAKDVRDAVTTPQSLIWLDCYGDYLTDYPFDFISKDELEEINSNLGLNLPSKGEMLNMEKNYLHSLLNAIEGNCILISAKADCGNILPVHPVVTILMNKNVANEQLPLSAFDLQQEKEETRFAEVEGLQIDGLDMTKRKNVISQSSLDKLLEQPLDYVIEKVADMYEPDTADDLATENGTIAHKVVELMVKGKKFNKGSIDRFLDEAIEAEGNLIKKPENTFALEEFKQTTKKSIEILVDILKENNLEVVESEMKIDGVEINGIGKCTGILDLVAKRENDYFYIDFKNSSSDFYSEKIRLNKSLQFEMYKKLFEQHSGEKLKAVAYYLFPLKTLFISKEEYDNFGLKGENIKPIEPDTADDEYVEDAWQTILDNYSDRQLELKEGTIATDNSAPYQMNHIVLKNKIK